MISGFLPKGLGLRNKSLEAYCDRLVPLDTIACEYWNRTRVYGIYHAAYRPHDYYTLAQIVRERAKTGQYMLPDQHDVIIHLRLGDVLSFSSSSSSSSTSSIDDEAQVAVSQWEHGGQFHIGERYYVRSKNYYELVWLYPIP